MTSPLVVGAIHIAFHPGERHLPLRSKNVKDVAEICLLPLSRLVLACPRAGLCKQLPLSCSSTRVAPETTYLPFITGIGCDPRRAW